MTVDRAGRDYWDDVWNGQPSPRIVGSADRGIRNYVTSRFCELLVDDLGPVLPGRLIEVGCGNSAWLPWYSTGLGADVWGLDYSEPGCRRARAVLARSRTDGTIVCADMFDPPKELFRSFDAVVSWGVVEHFEDTPAALAAIADLLRPSGRMLTVIPNLAGAMGWLQKSMNRPVYDKHKVIDREQLTQAHRDAGLEVRRCEYFLPANFGVINLHDAPVGPVRALTQRVLVAGLARFAWMTWTIQRRTGWDFATKLWSPYVVASAHRASEC